MANSYYSKRLSLSTCLAVLVLHFGSVSGGAQSGQKLEGVVTDPFGPVITNAVISISSADRVLKAITDQEGRFSFANVPPGAYQMEASAAGFATKMIEFVYTEKRDPKPLVIALAVASGGDCGNRGLISYADESQPGRWKLTVRVLDSKLALAGASVSLLKTDALLPQSTQRTGKQGESRFTNLEAGQYSLTVSQPGYRVAQTKRFWVTRENQTTVVMEMLRNGQIIVCE